MELKEIAKNIREELKKHGITTKQVSVKSKYSGYESIINIIIKDLTINKKIIENIVKKYEKIRWDDYTNEILEGGNVFINIDFDYKVLKEKTEELIPLAQELIKKGKNYKAGECITVAKKDDLIILYSPHYYNCNSPEITLCKKTNSCILDDLERYYAGGIYNIAEALAILKYQYSFEL